MILCDICDWSRGGEKAMNEGRDGRKRRSTLITFFYQVSYLKWKYSESSCTKAGENGEKREKR